MRAGDHVSEFRSSQYYEGHGNKLWADKGITKLGGSSTILSTQVYQLCIPSISLASRRLAIEHPKPRLVGAPVGP